MHCSTYMFLNIYSGYSLLFSLYELTKSASDMSVAVSNPRLHLVDIGRVCCLGCPTEGDTLMYCLALIFFSNDSCV